jgi:hypothetical protein
LDLLGRELELRVAAEGRLTEVETLEVGDTLE